jgi:hypothetical protein
MDAPDATLATVAAGRAATVAQLRQLATRLEEMPVEAVGVAEPHLAQPPQRPGPRARHAAAIS